MKSRTKTYLLLVTVLGIWGTIGYKIVSGVSPTISEEKQENFDVAFNPKTNTEVDTFSIQTLERDPFLGTLTKKKKSVTRTLKKPINNKANNLPQISYNGLVKKQNTTDMVFVVNINNNQYLLNKGQVIDSITLINGNDKDITIRYKNKNQTIKRQ
ncbi:hypothetical protein [Psychroserpens burtonensis]|uniref:hypothetical protein n=1 Tax=Psychroserpens burtonensis TaxID=49278 RepID=UPI0012F781C7|nr:hypothetical protein [Psychroserpens burtonensis]